MQPEPKCKGSEKFNKLWMKNKALKEEPEDGAAETVRELRICRHRV